MPQSSNVRSQSVVADMVLRAYMAGRMETVTTAMKQEGGFTSTLKALKKDWLLASGKRIVINVVIHESTSEKDDTPVQTDRRRGILRNTEQTGRASTDLQLSPTTDQSIEDTLLPGDLTSDELLCQLSNSGIDASASLLCTIELTRFVPSQHQVLFPLLWQFILAHRNSNNREELVGAAAAIRKYVAIMPMDQMGSLATLLDTGNRSPLPIDLEIEVAKMVYRNFEVHPPVVEDPQPELARRFWEMVQAYINPRVLSRDKHPAVTSMAIEAIVSMRSPLAEPAWRAAIACPYRWFTELINDELDELHEKWESKNPGAASWLHELRCSVLARV